MAKKSFEGLNGLLKKTTPAADPKDTPKPQKKEAPKSTSKLGTKPDETRATFIVNEELLDGIKAIALWDRASIKEVMHEALQDFIEKQPKKKMKEALDFYVKKKK